MRKSRKPRRVPRFMGLARKFGDPAESRRIFKRAETFTLENSLDARVTGLVMHTQQAENWCWAAVIDCLLRARGEVAGQAAIVARHVGHDCPPQTPAASSPHHCRATQCPNPCNGPHSIDIAFGGWAIASQQITGLPRPELQRAIHNEISSGSPVVVRMADGNTAHIIVIVGLSAGPFAFANYLTPYLYNGPPFPVAETGTLFDRLLDGMGIGHQLMKATHFFRIAS